MLNRPQKDWRSQTPDVNFTVCFFFYFLLFALMNARIRKNDSRKYNRLIEFCWFSSDDTHFFLLCWLKSVRYDTNCNKLTDVIAANRHQMRLWKANESHVCAHFDSAPAIIITPKCLYDRIHTPNGIIVPYGSIVTSVHRKMCVFQRRFFLSPMIISHLKLEPCWEIEREKSTKL